MILVRTRAGREEKNRGRTAAGLKTARVRYTTRNIMMCVYVYSICTPTRYTQFSVTLAYTLTSTYLHRYVLGVRFAGANGAAAAAAGIV